MRQCGGKESLGRRCPSSDLYRAQTPRRLCHGAPVQTLTVPRILRPAPNHGCAQDKPSEEPDEHGFVHPAVMAAMDPQSEEYTKAYAAFECAWRCRQPASFFFFFFFFVALLFTFSPALFRPGLPSPPPPPPPLLPSTANSALYYEKYGDYYKQQAASGSNGTTLAEGEVEEVCEVPDRHIGRVIGKGGQTVRTIQGISSTHIDIPNECAPGTDMRMVKIRGTPNNISYCRKIIAEYVSKGEDASMPLPSESEVDPTKPITCKTIEVPDEHVGRIIGKGGATVRMIQDAHHCHVDIAKAPPAGSQQREVKITGVPDSIAATEALIMQKVRGDGPMGGMPLLGGALGGPLGQNEIRVFVPAEHVGRYAWGGGREKERWGARFLSWACFEPLHAAARPLTPFFSFFSPSPSLPSPAPPHPLLPTQHHWPRRRDHSRDPGAQRRAHGHQQGDTARQHAARDCPARLSPAAPVLHPARQPEDCRDDGRLFGVLRGQ